MTKTLFLSLCFSFLSLCFSVSLSLSFPLFLFSSLTLFSSLSLFLSVSLSLFLSLSPCFLPYHHSEGITKTLTLQIMSELCVHVAVVPAVFAGRVVEIGVVRTFEDAMYQFIN